VIFEKNKKQNEYFNYFFMRHETARHTGNRAQIGNDNKRVWQDDIDS
jgi:hypothetical protein